jgi:nanoRNase/pAp phosphatase (c-di-AMP/oligoRNAs hydrolase)
MEKKIHQILEDPEIKSRCDTVVKENLAYENYLLNHTTVFNNISVTDFRSLETAPDGNRFLTYSIFQDSIASVKIRFAGPDKTQVLISIGRSIFKPGCQVNIGNLLARFGGGGHAGAGGCTLSARTADADIEQIIAALVKNEKEA